MEVAGSPRTRLTMTDISKRFGATVALDRVDFSVAPGQVHGLVGENGAGKSTLMKALSGAVRPDEGRMWIDGRLHRPESPLDGRRAGVAMIYQELSLAPHLPVEENILLGVEPLRGPFLRRREMRRRAIEAMQRLGIGHVDPSLPVRRLQPAEQQLVEVARALVVGARLLVLDEPTSSLSQSDVQKLFRMIRSLRDRGHSIVYISHFLEEVQQVCDQYTVLRDGKLVESGRVRDVTVDLLAARMVGRSLTSLYPRSQRRPAATVLELSEWTSRIVRRAHLKLRRGEVLGIAGLVGAGRTELLRGIFGLDPVREGKIRVAAFEGPADPPSRWKQGVGMVSENRKEEGLALGLSVAENLTLTKLSELGPFGLVLARRQNRRGREWIERLDIRCQGPEQPALFLSGGNQQKVALARLLYHDADVLLLDEPTRGVDIGSKAEIYRLIDRLAVGEAGKPRAILMASSYLPELLGVCDRIAVMCRGRLVETRAAADWTEHEIMLAATGSAVVS
ncbi:MAG TPA: sugar ABC transporter ATP-binding protein [Acidobacteriota bacterium]|nr:sugar ABC transporter ATP-binding protein [Acidobacteriota bacterium]